MCMLLHVVKIGYKQKKNIHYLSIYVSIFNKICQTYHGMKTFPTYFELFKNIKTTVPT